MYIVLTSIAMQLVAAVLALRLIPLTGKRWSWILVSCALLGMVGRRLYTLSEIIKHETIPDPEFQILGLVTSLAMMLGIGLIAPIFTRLREANLRLAENEKRFRTVADFTHDWEYWRGPDGAILYMSPSCVRVTGYPRRDFVEAPELLVSIVHPDDREKVGRYLDEEFRNREIGDLDYRIVSADGSTHWLAHRSVPVFDADGTYLGVRVSNRNIDSRKNAEEQLKESRKQYYDLVQQARCIILELSSEGQVIFMNEYGLEFFGYSLDEIKGKSVSRIMVREEDANWRGLEAFTDQAMLNTGEIAYTETENLRKDGTRAWISWANSSVRNERGFVIGRLCVGIDITEHKSAERLREDVQRIVRHDLKSPLTGIIGIPGIIKDEENITPKQREMLKAVEDAGRQMLNQINQSVNLYKMELGTYDYHPEPVDFLQTARTVAESLTWGKTTLVPVELYLNGEPVREEDTLVLPGDEVLLYTMVSNLLKNALEAGGGKPVRLEFTTGRTCVFEVKNCVPVPPEIRKGFFEKYVTQGKRGGTGLGTYSARLSARVMGGDIALIVDSQGTTVRVELPGGSVGTGGNPA